MLPLMLLLVAGTVLRKHVVLLCASWSVADFSRTLTVAGDGCKSFALFCVDFGRALPLGVCCGSLIRVNFIFFRSKRQFTRGVICNKLRKSFSSISLFGRPFELSPTHSKNHSRMDGSRLQQLSFCSRNQCSQKVNPRAQKCRAGECDKNKLCVSW